MLPKRQSEAPQEKALEGDNRQDESPKTRSVYASALGRALDLLFWIAIAVFLLGFLLPPQIGDSKMYFWITFTLFGAAIARIAFVFLKQLKLLMERDS